MDVLLEKYYKYNNIFNLVICIIKKYIYRTKLKKNALSFERVKQEIVYYYNCEKYIYKKNGEIDYFIEAPQNISYQNQALKKESRKPA